jgi:hypothetical protein
LIVALAACTPAAPAQPKADVDPLVFTWLIAGHEMSPSSSLANDDALATYGREVVINAGYTTPWHGTCEEAKRETSTVTLVEVTADVDITPEGRARIKQFGIIPKPTEFKLVCQSPRTVPPLTMWVTGARAMTCFGGVCYLLSH